MSLDASTNYLTLPSQIFTVPTQDHFYPFPYSSAISTGPQSNLLNVSTVTQPMPSSQGVLHSPRKRKAADSTCSQASDSNSDDDEERCHYKLMKSEMEQEIKALRIALRAEFIEHTTTLRGFQEALKCGIHCNKSNIPFMRKTLEQANDEDVRLRDRIRRFFPRPDNEKSAADEDSEEEDSEDDYETDGEEANDVADETTSSLPSDPVDPQ